MKRKERVLEFWHIAIIALAILLFLLLRSSITGRVWYRDYGGYGGGLFDFFGFSFFSFSDMYASYGYVIDALIFLLIFLGLTQNVFKDKFKESKSLYVGVGIFLAFALLMWEEQTGTSLLYNFGPLAFIFFVLILLFLGVKWMRQEVGTGPFTSFFILYLAIYLLLFKTPKSQELLDALVSLWPGLGFLTDTLFDLLAVVAIVVLLLALVRFLWGKVEGTHRTGGH